MIRHRVTLYIFTITAICSFYLQGIYDILSRVYENETAANLISSTSREPYVTIYMYRLVVGPRIFRISAAHQLFYFYTAYAAHALFAYCILIWILIRITSTALAQGDKWFTKTLKRDRYLGGYICTCCCLVKSQVKHGKTMPCIRSRERLTIFGRERPDNILRGVEKKHSFTHNVRLQLTCTAFIVYFVSHWLRVIAIDVFPMKEMHLSIRHVPSNLATKRQLKGQLDKKFKTAKGYKYIN